MRLRLAPLSLAKLILVLHMTANLFVSLSDLHSLNYL